MRLVFAISNTMFDGMKNNQKKKNIVIVVKFAMPLASISAMNGM